LREGNLGKNIANPIFGGKEPVKVKECRIMLFYF